MSGVREQNVLATLGSKYLISSNYNIHDTIM